MQITDIYLKLVDYFDGSQTETAKALNVKQPSVNAWVSGKSKMGAKTALIAERATNGKFKAIDLCPDLNQPTGA